MKKINNVLFVCLLLSAPVVYSQNNIEVNSNSLPSSENPVMNSSLENNLSANPSTNLSTINNGLTFSEVFSLYEKEVQSIKLDDVQREKFTQQIINSNPENKLFKSQFFVVADRNPKHQVATIAFWNNENKTIEVSDFTYISTGSVRKEHFYTPVGWFENLPEHGSYRAEGTKNSKGIRGYGRKGMRVWDFGWVPSSSGFVKNLNIDIRLQMHATDPDILEKRLGRPDSKGCVRVHSSVNNFIDKYGLIDEKYENKKSWVLRKDRVLIQNAGNYLLVIDTQ